MTAPLPPPSRRDLNSPAVLVPALLSGCLPLLVQFPVFISLYYMLRIDLRYDICPSVNPITAEPPTRSRSRRVTPR